MPYSIRKLPNQDLYRVYNTQTKAIHSYSTTLENAKKQVKLLHMVDAGIPLKKQGGNISNPKLLELFKGTGSVGKQANKMGFKITSLDLDPIYTPDIETDILEWDYKKWSNENNYIPDMIWASPPCNTFSPMVYRLKERDVENAKPLSDRARLGTKILYKTIEIIEYFLKKNPKLLFIMENPRGMMRKDTKMKKLARETTLYCLYGDFKRKATDFWNNFPQGLKIDQETKQCPNKTIPVQDLKTIEERYSMPSKLIKHFLEEFKNQYGEKKGGSIETDKFDRDGIVSLPQFRSITINLPTYMYKRLPDIKGKPPPYRYRLVVPITSSRILSSRKNAVSLNINQKPIAKSKITMFRVEDEEPKLSDFSPADQLKIKAYYDKVKANETKTLDRIGNDEYEIKQRGKPLPCSNAVAKVVAKPVPKPKEQKKKKILRIEGDEDDNEEINIPDLEPDDKKSKVKEMVLQIEEKQKRIIEQKRKEDEREQEKAEFTPEKVLELVNSEKANNSWVNIQKNPFVSVRWLVDTDKDPYGGRLSNVENMEYFIKEPKRVYKVWGSEELIDPLTLKVLGEFTEPTKMLSNSFDFKLTDIGRQRLEEYKAIAKADEKKKLKKLKNVIDTMKEEEKPDIEKYKKLSSEYNDMVKVYKTKFSKEGKGLSAGDLRELLNATYDGKEKVAGYEIDKSLSTKTSKVYRNPETNQVVVGHMGTEGLMDWGNNAVFALGGKSAYKKTARYKEAEKVQRNAEKKYGAENISTIGHSQGGLQAELLGGKSKETITLNKATMIGQNKRNKNQTDIHTSGDIVSSLNPFQKRGKDDIVIKGKSYNPLNIHSAKSLRGLDENQIIGNGLENNISSNSIKMPNKWIEYVKEYASKNGMSYRDALRDPKCKAGYQR
jgi:site-specific DNA-cytosine methylase